MFYMSLEHTAPAVAVPISNIFMDLVCYAFIYISSELHPELIIRPVNSQAIGCAFKPPSANKSSRQSKG
jgi:hypothetical protein